MYSFVQYYKPQTFKVGNAKILFHYVKQVLKEDQIQIINLISNLCHSTNYMHGKKSFVIIYLLDTDGSTCQHVYVTSKFILSFE